MRMGSKHSEDTRRKMHFAWSPERRCELSERMSGKNNPLFGKKHSEEMRRKMRLAWTPEMRKNRSLIWTPEKRRKQAEIMSVRVMSNETRKKISESLKGKKGWNKGIPMSDEQKKKISESLKGFKHTEEAKKNMSDARRGKKFPSWRVKKLSGKNHHFYGKHHTEETREKISKSLKGFKQTDKTRKKLSMMRKGKKHHFYGKPCSDERKRKISESLKSNHNILGEKNPNWHNGKSFEPYGLDFNKILKEQIRQRDNYECQECHITQEQAGYTLRVHHIDFVKTHNNSSNLVTLCMSCHSQTNFNRADWTVYFRKLINS